LVLGWGRPQHLRRELGSKSLPLSFDLGPVPLLRCCLERSQRLASSGLDLQNRRPHLAGTDLAATFVGLVVDCGPEVSESTVPADVFQVDKVLFAVE
jgi:hypothetical protein